MKTYVIMLNRDPVSVIHGSVAYAQQKKHELIKNHLNATKDQTYTHIAYSQRYEWTMREIFNENLVFTEPETAVIHVITHDGSLCQGGPTKEYVDQ